MQDVAARLDGAVTRSVSRAARLDLDVPVRERGDEYVKASFGAWLLLTVLLLVGWLLIGPRDSWSGSLVAAALLTVPGGMAVLRGVHDRARQRYTTGGLPFLLALAVAFVGALATVQPVG